MKRILVLLLLILAPCASAGGSFGLRLDTNIYSGAYIVPLPGINLGYDDPSGFGVRGSIGGVVIGVHAWADASYRLELDQVSSLYAGAGVGLIVFLLGGPTLTPEVHALVGYEGRIGSGTSAFVEVSPGIIFFSTEVAPAISVAIGLRFDLK